MSSIYARTGLIAALFFVFEPTPRAAADLITWVADGTTNSWSDGDNWSNGAGPSATDTAFFGSDGSIFLPGEVTNSLDDNRVIGGLAYSNNSSSFHTTDLNNFTLSVFGSVNFNTNQGAQTTTTIRDGVLVVADPAGSFNVGRSFGASASGFANLSGLSQFAATVGEFHIATTTGANASGELKLAANNVIVADQVVVGRNGNGLLRLGETNEFVTPNFTVAKDFSNSRVEIVNGGSVQIGNASHRTLLSVADQDTNTLSSLGGRMDLTGGSLDAHLDGLIVGRKFGGSGNTTGEIVGGTGHVDIGGPGNTANVIIGQSNNGGTARGVVDFSGMQSLTANLNQMLLGQNLGGNASASVQLAATNVINANSIVVGDNGSADLRLGVSNTIVAREMLVGKDFSNATVDIISGGELQLGSSEQRTLLSIADQNTNTLSSLGGRVDLTGGTLDGHLDGLIVGRKFGGPGTTTGELIGGAGNIDIGADGNTANVIIGQSVNGGTVRGTVDLGSMQTLDANLNQLIVGQAIAGAAAATFYLPAQSTIDAHAIYVGDAADGVLRLGESTTIETESLIVANRFSNSRIEAPLGSTFTLGSADRSTNLSVGVFDANTNSSMSGEIDMSGSTLVAHLGEVVIGDRSGGGAGVGSGVLTIGASSANEVSADAVRMGIDAGRGTLNFHGGQLTVGTVEKGTGTATFNWQGGTLSVETFGTPANFFDLNNLGTGTLAPGESPGGTQVYGNYRQGAAAEYQVELGGTTPVAQYDQLGVSLQAQLAGTLDARLYNGFAPSPSDTFTVVNAVSLTGQFANAAPGAAGLQTPFGTFDVSYASAKVTLSNFVPDPLAPAASIGALNGYADEVLGGSGVAGGVDAAFLDNERGILYGQFDVIDGVALDDLIGSGALPFDQPNFALTAGQLQVWELSFDGDAIGPSGLQLAFGYDDAGLTLMQEEALDVFHYENGLWMPLGGVVDTSANTISVLTASLSPFAIGVVPEPSSLALAGVALVATCCGFVRRKRALRRRLTAEC